MDIPNNARVVIIEGIAGAGKTTLHDVLKDHFKDKKIYIFTEEELLMSWKHVFIPNLLSLRIKFLNNILDYIETELKKDDDSIFILERFHITVKIFFLGAKNEFHDEYELLLSRVRKLPVCVLIPKLKESQIKERSAHKERGHQWDEYLRLKLEYRGYDDLEKIYIDEQRQVIDITKEQKIPFSITEVKIEY
jgi:thymidylate kinase